MRFPIQSPDADSTKHRLAGVPVGCDDPGCGYLPDCAGNRAADRASAERKLRAIEDGTIHSCCLPRTEEEMARLRAAAGVRPVRPDRDQRPHDPRAWPDAPSCGLCGHRQSEHWVFRCQGDGEGCTCERFVSQRAVKALRSWKGENPALPPRSRLGHLADAAVVHAELAPEPPRDPDELARSLSAAAGHVPWSSLPEESRQAWRQAAADAREDLRTGRLKLEDLADKDRMRQVVAQAAEQVVEQAHQRAAAELDAAREIQHRAACAAAVDLVVEILRVCCRAATEGMVELDIVGRPRPAAPPDQPDPYDDIAARFAQLEMD